jgi:hypothetical protein
MERFYGTSFDVAQAERNLMFARLARPTDAPITVEETISADRTAKLNRAALTYGLPLVVTGAAMGLAGCTTIKNEADIFMTTPVKEHWGNMVNSVIEGGKGILTHPLVTTSVSFGIGLAAVDTVFDWIRKKGPRQEGPGRSFGEKARSGLTDFAIKCGTFTVRAAGLKLSLDLFTSLLGSPSEGAVFVVNPKSDVFSKFLAGLVIPGVYAYQTLASVIESIAAPNNRG